jgi:tetratricopeptide (TPR) repeat protein
LREKITQVTLLVNQEKYQEADALLGKISFTQPTVEGAAVLRSLGEWQACRGGWKTAAEHFSKLLQVDQLDSWDVVTLDCLECGPALLETGDLEGYEHFRQAAVARFAGTTYPVADRILKISLLLPADQKLIESLVPLAGVTEQTFKTTVGGANEDSFRAAWQCVSLALVEYRRGHYAKAADWSQRCLAFPEFNASRVATSHVLLALAWQQLGKTEPARAELALGRDAIEGKFRAGLDRGSAPHGFWFDWVFAQILLREAESLIPAA